MFIVRNAYIGKAENYLRYYGTFNFGPGGAFHDIPWVIRRFGIVPESAYDGLNYGSKTHNHSEMSGMLKAMVEVLAKKSGIHLGHVFPRADGRVRFCINATVLDFIPRDKIKNK